MKGQEKSEAEGRVEGGAFAFGAQAAFGGFIAQSLEGHLPQDGEIVRGGGIPHLTVILAKDHIQNPVAAVLHTPVAPDKGRKAFGIGGDGAEIIMDLR